MVWSRLKKTKKLSIFLLIVILLAVGMIVSVFIGYRQVSNAPELLLSSIKEGANLSLGKIRQTATRDGKKEWSLEADSANYMEAENKVDLKNLSVIYFLEDNREVYLEADRGILQTDTNDIEFSGNVVIRNEAYQMKTEHLNYEHGRRIIICDQSIRIAGQGAELTAESAKYDLNADKIVLKGNVVATIPRDFEVIPDKGKR
ncbi:MAG: LPS export ABC transporter periplasmic protein LptC [Desulfobacterales bacterium]|nr:LPS export ABC transporter periplasmic protein LptC [Desulfobacterales bacterium]